MLGNDLGSSMLGISWSPIKLPSLLHWYRFDNGITVDASNDVTKWEDQKGSNHLTATGVAANSPLYSSGAVMFNAAADIMTFTTAPDLAEFSIYMRSESDDLGTSADETLMENGSSIFIRITATSQSRVKWDGERNDFTFSPALTKNTKFNYGLERDNDGDIELYIDGSTDIVTKTGSNNHNIATSATFELATLGQPALTSKFYEIVICNNSLSSTDRELLNTYLNAI